MIIRNTIQRSLVFEAVNKLKCHATADEVYEAIIRDNPSVSRGTVYRNLAKLSETGRIRKIEMPDGPDRFDHRCENHYHARCTKCGQIFDVDMEYIPSLEDHIRDTRGFTFTGHDIFFRGICPDCQSR